MKIQSRWRTAVHPASFYFTSMWKWTCFCPIYLIIWNRFFIPFGFEKLMNDRFNGYKYHATILNIDIFWRKFGKSWILATEMKTQEEFKKMYPKATSSPL